MATPPPPYGRLSLSDRRDCRQSKSTGEGRSDRDGVAVTWSSRMIQGKARAMTTLHYQPPNRGHSAIGAPGTALIT